MRWWAWLGVFASSASVAGERAPWAQTSCTAPPDATYTWWIEKPGARDVAPSVSSGSFTVHVDEATNAGLSVTVTEGEEADPSMPPEVRAALEAAEADGRLVEPLLRVQVAGGNTATVQDLEGWTAYFGAVFDVMQPYLFPPGSPPSGTVAARGMMSSPGVVNGMLLRKLVPATGLWCSQVARPVVRYTTTRPNPLGGAPIEVKGISRYRRAGDLLTVHTQEAVVFDPETLVKQLLAGGSAPVEPQRREAMLAQLRAVALQRTADQVVELSTGLTVRFDLVDVAEGEPGETRRNVVHVERVAGE